MKKLNIFLIGLFLLANAAIAQNAFRNVANSFSKNDQFFSSELSKKTINLYVKHKKPQAEVGKVLENIDYLKVVSFSTNNAKDISRFVDHVNNQYALSEYIPFKVNRSGVNNQLIYLKEKNDVVSNLLVINTNYANVAMVEIVGNIDLEKIALLQEVIKIDGLESLNTINNSNSKEKVVRRVQNWSNPYSIGENYFMPYNAGGVSVYNRWGTKLMDTQSEPGLLINGYRSSKDINTALLELNSECVQSINVVNDKAVEYPNGHIEVMLKGDINTVYTVCEGVLYFGQNGYLHCFNINDECSPNLLFDCSEKPLSEILKMEPEQIKSIELTSNPRNCKGNLEGEYVVVVPK